MKAISFKSCTRCGCEHTGLEPRRLARPFAPPEAGGVVWTHWAACPTNGDPILVAIDDTASDDSALADLPSGADRFEDAVEWCYWRFDALRAGPDRKDAGLWPMAERDAYKSVLRQFYAKWRVPLSVEMRKLMHECPLGYADGKVISTRSTTDADVIAWLQKLGGLASDREQATRQSENQNVFGDHVAATMTRDVFVEKVVALMESAPESLAREMGEALVGMGVSTLEQIGVSRDDIAKSIVDGRNAS